MIPDEIGSTHSWNWTSHLALECAPHSVRLRSRYNSHVSQWKQEQTHAGIKLISYFGSRKIFKVIILTALIVTALPCLLTLD